MERMQEPKLCLVCKKSSFATVGAFVRGEKSFTRYECKACLVQFWWPVQHPGAAWYEADNRYLTSSVLKPKITRAYHRLFLQRHGAKMKGAMVLDVGCGSGEFLSALQERGATVWGIDIDKSAIKAARNHFGLANLFAESWSEFFLRTNLPLFDFITCFEVIEHVRACLVSCL